MQVRYLDIQLYNSDQFYSCAIGHIETFEEFKEITMLNDNNLQSGFNKRITKYFRDDILYASQLHELVFNDEGEIKSLTREMYNGLKKIISKFDEYTDKAYNAVHDMADTIKKSYCSPGIKELARFRHHDGLITSFCSDGSSLIMDIPLYYIPRKYTFSNVKSIYSSDEESIDGKRIICEELFLDNGLYEYNILLGSVGGDIKIMDVSITFEDVSFEEQTDLKEKIVQEVLEGTRTIEEAAWHYKVGRQALTAWVEERLLEKSGGKPEIQP